MPEQPTNQSTSSVLNRFTNSFIIINLIRIFNIIKTIPWIAYPVLVILLVAWLTLMFYFTGFVTYNEEADGYRGDVFKWARIVIVGMILIFIPLILSVTGTLLENKIWNKDTYWTVFVLTLIFVLLASISSNISDLVRGLTNSEDWLRDAYDALVKNNEGHAPFGWAILFLTAVSIVVLSRTYWWFATAMIGIVVASFILIVPPLFENIPLNKMNWVVNILVIAASGVVLPFIAAKEIGTIEPGGMNRSTFVSVGIKSLAVPGLVFAFISSTNLNTYTPKNETNGTEENATGSIENIIDGHHYVFQGQLHIELNDGLEGNIIIGGLSKSSKALAFELG